MITIKPVNFEYDAFEFTEENTINDIIKFIEDHNCEYLNFSIDKNAITINYKDICYESQVVTFYVGWYFWFDEMGLLNTASPEYIKENFEVYEHND